MSAGAAAQTALCNPLDISVYPVTGGDRTTVRLHIIVYFAHLSSTLTLSCFISVFILSDNSIPFYFTFLNILLSENPHVTPAFRQQDQVTG